MQHTQNILSNTHLIDSIKIPTLAQLWITRLLINLGVYNKAITKHGIQLEGLAELIGIEQNIELIHENSFNYDETVKKLFNYHKWLEHSSDKLTLPQNLIENVEFLKTAIGFSHVEAKILEFIVVMKMTPLLQSICELAPINSTTRIYHHLSLLLNIPIDEIKKAIHSELSLEKCGLFHLTDTFYDNFAERLDSLNQNIAESIYENTPNLGEILEYAVVLSDAPELQLSDFEHLKDQTLMIRNYLQVALKQRQHGVNILLYGVPGTGKTQLARIIAKSLKSTLYEIAYANYAARSISGSERLSSYAFAQRVLNQKGHLFLFDEIEDVFSEKLNNSDRRHEQFSKKAWFNHIFETNPIPTFWLSNSIRDIDPAFIRRFDIVIEMEIPSVEQRRKIIRKSCNGLISTKLINHIAEVQHLAPALVTRASRVLSTLKNTLSIAERDKLYQILINNSLSAMQLDQIPVLKNSAKNQADSTELPFDPKYVNTKMDIAKLKEGLLKSKTGRICLYGPPGTGKSAYARWLAKSLDMPLISKRYSDMADKYLGDTEKNIAKAFQEATEKGAILVIDEIDSFLQDRRNATYQWESSQVNEMLTQLEAFEGIFIGSTNLMQNLDQAVLRRFDLILNFDYLTETQIEQLFIAYCSKLKLNNPTLSDKRRVKRINQLTAGDFSAVIRQARFNAIETIEQFILALEQICELKEGQKHQIGFLT